jgi:hypothetical protein
MDNFERLQRAFENVRRIMDGMCDEEVALMHRSAVETAIAAFRREEITAEQRNALFRILQPDGRIIIVEPIPHDDEV